MNQPFEMTQTAATMQKLALTYQLEPDGQNRCFLGKREGQALIRVSPPPLHPLPPDCRDLDHYLTTLKDEGGTHLVVLVQAGASAIGMWQGQYLRRHKVIKKYVTRGKGKAQTTYLKTKGKSRYGSRLRLNNAKLHLQETNTRLHEWCDLYAPLDLVFYSCPVRLWSEVFKAEPTPPFSKEAAHKIPLDVRVPKHEELLRIHSRLRWGWLEDINPDA